MKNNGYKVDVELHPYGIAPIFKKKNFNMHKT